MFCFTQVLYMYSLQGVAKLEVEVTNLAAKAGKGTCDLAQKLENHCLVLTIHFTCSHY